MSGYTVGMDDDEPFIICDSCGFKSFNSNDIAERYCGACHKYHDDRSSWILLPCKPGICQLCAVDHPPEQPHNQQSLYYQYHFYSLNGRWPTWEDAMAHCSDEMRGLWKGYLRERGVKI
jgi:hypothetical protein